MTLTDFLLARIAERESEILNGWDSDGAARIATMWTGGEPGYTTVASDHADDVWIADGHEVENARHVRVLFDPAHELARCAADRQIIEATRFDDAPESVVDFYIEEQRKWAKPWPLRLPQHVEVMVNTLRVLASVYADHADYQQEWRP